MKIDSNADAFLRDLEDLIDTFNFDASIGNMSLGKRMANKTAEMIALRSATQQKGASVQWEPNKEPYKSDKAKKYNVHDLAGVRTGQMLSIMSLLGETEIQADEIVMDYGIDQPATRSYGSSHFDPKADGKATDREKAKWFTEGRAGIRGRDARGRFTAGSSGGQPARPFYELDDEIADAVFELVTDALAKHLEQG